MDMRTIGATAGKVAAGYLVLAGLWISFSDRVLYYFANDPVALTSLQTYKGWFFVLVTAIGLFFMLRHSLLEVADSAERLRKSHEELAATHEELLANEEELRSSFNELLTIQAKMRRQNECLITLNETALALMNRRDAKGILEVITQKAVNTGNSTQGGVYLMTPDREFMELQIPVGDMFVDCVRQRRGEGVVGRVWATGEPLVIPRYDRWEGRLPLQNLQRLRTAVGIPIRTRGEVTGVLSINFLEEREISEEDLALFGNFAELAAIALANAELNTQATAEIEERKKVEANLRRTQQMTEALIEALPDFVFRADRDGQLLQAKSHVRFPMRYDFTNKVGQNIADFTQPPELAQRILHGIRQAIQTGIMQRFEFELPVDGETKYRQMRIVATEFGEAVGVLSDITDYRQTLDEMIYMTQHDSMTGLYNRAFFEEELRRYDKRTDLPVAVVVCDIDGLKLVNDTLGPEAGDRMLTDAAEIISRSFGQDAVVARLGGDDFAVILPTADRAVFDTALREMAQSVTQYNSVADIPLSVSSGYAVRISSDERMIDIYKAADTNMSREKLHRNQSARSAIVNTLAKALEARDFVTDGHADRLQHLTERLAIAAGMPESLLPDLRLLGRFHDIGKVGIPDYILFKPARLSPEEYEIMKRHSEIGYRIALASAELAPIADWILKHQEWWNGKGYPLGIRGEDIPLACRVVAIADAYDAMTNDRPYRKALPLEEAIAELRRCAGTQFDPQLVEIFVRITQAEQADNMN